MMAAGAHFEIRLDGVVRTHRDQRDTAIEAAKRVVDGSF